MEEVEVYGVLVSNGSLNTVWGCGVMLVDLASKYEEYQMNPFLISQIKAWKRKGNTGDSECYQHFLM